MIKLLSINGAHCPVFVCDQCGERIKQAKDGMYVYYVNGDWKEDVDSISIIHKGRCDDLFTEQNGKENQYWIELNDLIIDLVHNTKANLKSGSPMAEYVSPAKK